MNLIGKTSTTTLLQNPNQQQQPQEQLIIASNFATSSTPTTATNTSKHQMDTGSNSTATNTNQQNPKAPKPPLSRMGSLNAIVALPGSRYSQCKNPPPQEIIKEAHDEFLVPIYDFHRHVQNHLLLCDEYYTLENYNQNNSYQIVDGHLKHNTVKNRYTNILPCDRTRVKLTHIEGLEGSDYINANFIDGDIDKQYICTQGPLQNTFSDFWRMVWENSSSIVVMLSKELENCRVKCDRYWSDNEPIEYDQFTLELDNIEKDLDREIIIRTFKLTNHSVKETRNIIHYQYEGWPDHNTPSETESLRYLLHTINRTQNSLPEERFRKAPIVVHCSAGVGRTGTFCAIHTMINRIENSQPGTQIDFGFYPIIHKLRRQRPGMVQQLEQYLFCYATINDELRERESGQTS